MSEDNLGKTESQQPQQWGTPAAMDFFMRWTSTHLENSIYRHYHDEIDAKIKELYRADEPEHIWYDPESAAYEVQASVAELPLGVWRESEIYDSEVPESIGWQLFLTKVNPVTGKILDDGHISVATIYGDQIDTLDGTFTEEQCRLLIEQYEEQEAAGLHVDWS